MFRELRQSLNHGLFNYTIAINLKILTMRQNIDRTIEDCYIIQLQNMKNMARFVQNKLPKN